MTPNASQDSTASPASEPTPPPTFDVLSLSQETREALAEMGYLHPTPVQRAVFEPAGRGLDLVVQAQTGTGKTTAFGLPIVEHAVRRKEKKVQVLVLCPTRELALQVGAEIERLGKHREIVPLALYGGAPMGRQIDALASGKHQVVVGTPGRILDHLSRGTLDPNGIRMLVLDEADEMLSMGFERELTAILERLPKGRQTLLFSATVPPDIERIAKERLREPEFITLSGDHVGALKIAHYVYFVTKADKVAALLRVIEVENPESAVVFCNTKAETERVAEALQRQGFDADWLNADLPQNDREKVMSRTREGKLRFLVATDVAARGIDISHLTHVINYDFPDNTERYVHRTGRTGRAGRTGTAISLITPKDVGNLYYLRLVYKIRPVEKQIPTAGELKTRAETDLVQLLIEAHLSKPIHPDDLALARRLLTHESAEQIVAGLLRDYLGVRPDALEEAEAARRSTKAPPPPEKPASERGRRPREDRERDERREERRVERRREAREERPRRGPQKEARPQPSTAPSRRGVEAMADWHPPEEPGDDEPIFRWEETPLPSAGEPKAARKGGRGRDEAPSREDGDLVEIFVNIGRRDGARPADFVKLLEERAGLDESRIGRIRIRDRHSFVLVERASVERSLDALDNATIAGKTARAERSRPRDSGPSIPNEG